MGDPAGIGPEVAVKALSQPHVYEMCRPVVVGKARALAEAIKIARLNLTLQTIEKISQAAFRSGTIDVLDLKNVDWQEVVFGKISAQAGKIAFEAVRTVIELALAKKVEATVTGPINKEALHLAGHHFPGHTEIYAHYTNTSDFAMLLIYGHLRVIHVSTHVALRQACELVKKERILKVIKLLHEACQKLGIKSPRIGVAGLNPHASDGGLFGAEEKEEIMPAIRQAKSLGLAVEGPFPPDILFPMAKGGYFDGCVAMYHDQGHIPFKLLGFNWNMVSGSMRSVNGVNITTGLPIIRVSVDHGTAFEIAGKGIASADSMIQAIEYAAKLAKIEN